MSPTQKIHRLVLNLHFAAGIHPGADKAAGNRLVIALDGRRQPILRGTALAGALRHAFIKSLDPSAPQKDAQDTIARWFGRAIRRGSTQPEVEIVDKDGSSPLRVSDVPLEAGPPVLRQHNAIDRHRGSVRDNALFSLEALPPGTHGRAILELEVTDIPDEAARAFLSRLVEFLDGGLTLGGNAARGIGRVELAERPNYRCFDLTDLDDHADLLDERYERDDEWKPVGGETWDEAEPSQKNLLQVRLQMSVPRGQDFLVGDGQTIDHALEPQRVIGTDGDEYWCLPGSSLRGILRGWMTRLAAREDKEVADNVQRFRKKGAPSGDDIAWACTDEAKRKEIVEALADDPSALNDIIACPITRLFGSAVSKGRIHISDALAKKDKPADKRMHVAVDAVTGGANDGFLFSNTVLSRRKLEFTVSIRIEQPTEDEVRWLARSIQAIDRGLLRIGSSKAGGRLALKDPPQASGPNAELVSAIKPSEVSS